MASSNSSKSYFSVIISISLVLFMLGITGLLVLKAKSISDSVKENIGITVYLRDDVKDVDVKRLQKSLDASRFVKTTEFISKEDAAEILQADLGEDFVDFLGYNPLLTSIDVRMNAEYAHPDSLTWIEADLLKNPKIRNVDYHKDLLTAVNENIQKITVVLVGFSIMLLFVAMALINSTIRLSIYSRRFIIRSMQLVGATPQFIMRPFVMKSIVNGFYGALISIVLMAVVVYSIQKQMPEIFGIDDVTLYAMVIGGVIGLGLFISWLSTTFAVRRYLKLKTDQLYR
ncbi:MAG: cell division transport system permease protein [Salibacteraceae bacterium]|jgi:cell division transport system permease protein